MATIQVINVSTPNDGLGDTLRASQVKANENFAELNAKKVEVVAGKGLSTNDYSDAEKTKLAGIETGAEKNVQANWLQNDNTQDDYIIGKPSTGNIISYGTYSLVGQNLTIFAGWVWQINSLVYTNSTDIIINFPFCSAGNQRIDLVVFNTLNSAERVEGGEAVSNPFAPALIENSILFGTLLITDSTVNAPIVVPSTVPFPKIQILATAGQTVFDIGTTALAKAVFREGALLDDGDWSQAGTEITTFPFELNERFKPI